MMVQPYWWLSCLFWDDASPVALLWFHFSFSYYNYLASLNNTDCTFQTMGCTPLSSSTTVWKRTSLRQTSIWWLASLCCRTVKLFFFAQRTRSCCLVPWPFTSCLTQSLHSLTGTLAGTCRNFLPPAKLAALSTCESCWFFQVIWGMLIHPQWNPCKAEKKLYMDRWPSIEMSISI